MGASLWPDGQTSSDWYDVAGLMGEMSRDTGHSYSILLSSAGSPEKPDLMVECIAAPMTGQNAEAAPLECLRFLASSQRLKTMKAVIFFALYQMNFQLDKPEDPDSPF